MCFVAERLLKSGVGDTLGMQLHNWISDLVRKSLIQSLHWCIFDTQKHSVTFFPHFYFVCLLACFVAFPTYTHPHIQTNTHKCLFIQHEHYLTDHIACRLMLLCDVVNVGKRMKEVRHHFLSFSVSCATQAFVVSYIEMNGVNLWNAIALLCSDFLSIGLCCATEVCFCVQ